MKKILGLDLGTTSIGWAFVHEPENPSEKASIQKIGTRVNPISTDEKSDFEKGKSITLNADRTQKRSARRNLDRYQDRRQHLIDILIKNGFITAETPLTEIGPHTTHETLALRSKAASEKIEKEEFARVLLTINKKRGYKSSRKLKTEEEDGQLIDGMEVARHLAEKQLTPGQYAHQLLLKGTKILPDFYRSDLQTEFDLIWDYQSTFYPEILTPEFREKVSGTGRKNVSIQFRSTHGVELAENKGKEKKQQAYHWRNDALTSSLDISIIAYLLSEINGDLASSSGYLGAISDRSKNLYFNRQTVGQYLYTELSRNPHFSTKKRSFIVRIISTSLIEYGKHSKHFIPK